MSFQFLTARLPGDPRRSGPLREEILDTPLLTTYSIGICRGVRSGSLNISTRDDKREQVSTILVNISVNEAVVFTNIFQLLVVLVLLGRILDADWSENDVRIGWSSVYCTMGSH